MMPNNGREASHRPVLLKSVVLGALALVGVLFINMTWSSSPSGGDQRMLAPTLNGCGAQVDQVTIGRRKSANLAPYAQTMTSSGNDLDPRETDGSVVCRSDDDYVSTHLENAPWWQADLEEVFYIDSMKLWIPDCEDCYHDKQRRIRVTVSDSPIKGPFDRGTYEFTTTIPGDSERGFEIPVENDLTGQHIRISLMFKGTLKLCEIEIFGSPLKDGCRFENACHPRAHCHPFGHPGQYECICKEGYIGNGWNCARDVGCPKCGAHQHCRERQCVCDAGFVEEDGECRVNDPCKSGMHSCSSDAKCFFLGKRGKYECYCKPGFFGDGRTCDVLDECQAGTHDCDEMASCTFISPGNWQCKCDAGYVGDGKSCKMEDPCTTGDNHCHKTRGRCINDEPGHYRCECQDEFVGDGRLCSKPVWSYHPQAPSSVNNVQVEATTRASATISWEATASSKNVQYFLRLQKGSGSPKYIRCSDPETCTIDVDADVNYSAKIGSCNLMGCRWTSAVAISTSEPKK